MVREVKSWARNEYAEITFYAIFGVIMAIVLPLFLGFVLRAFEETLVAGRPLQFGDFLVSFMIYYIMIVGGLIGLIALKVREMILTKRGEHIARQSKPNIMAVAYMHDPEIDGALYNMFRKLGLKIFGKNPMRWSLSMTRMFIIGTLLFGTFGLLQTANPDLQVVGIPQLQFQFTKTADVLFSAEPAAFGETTIMIFMLSLLVGINAYLTSKFKLPIWMFWFITFMLICPLIGLTWMGYHLIVYGSSETALFGTFIFGWLGSTLTILTGSFILWYVWHFWNNFFAKLTKVATRNEDVIFISILLLVLLLIVWIIGEIILKKLKNKEERVVIVPTE